MRPSCEKNHVEQRKFEIFGIFFAFKTFCFFVLDQIFLFSYYVEKVKGDLKEGKNGRTMPPRSQIMAA